MTGKRLALCMALILMAAVAGAAAADDHLTVTQETLLVLPDGDSFEGLVFAVIENTGTATRQFTGGLAELYDAADKRIALEELSAYDCNPEALAPGEKGLLYISIKVPGAHTAGEIAAHSLTLESTQEVAISVARYPAAASYQEGDGAYIRNRYAAAVVQNQTDVTLRDFFAVFALRDEGGNLMYITSGTWASSGILSRSAMEIRLRVDARVVDDWVQKGIAPAAAEAIVFKTFPE